MYSKGLFTVHLTTNSATKHICRCGHQQTHVFSATYIAPKSKIFPSWYGSNRCKWKKNGLDWKDIKSNDQFFASTLDKPPF